MTQTDEPGAAVAADVERRVAALRRLSGRLTALTAATESPGGTVRAVCRYGRGVSELVIAPDAAEVEGARLPMIVQRTINTATDEVNRLAIGLLRELHSGTREVADLLNAAAPPPDPDAAAQLTALRDLWSTYLDTVTTSLEILQSTTLERSS
ncbi:hypothetical protein [Thermomonospora umbrina]|uniref:YbaB/EbfC DNA-binding family protein n=1 Tax=Thermomonospora umbrina TaxID=111806 RepID=A0A3D9SKX5_9ACTN|nr:hypothetical protein [Thermomonospora umbrina]REE96569.1 hypothetical protein DFJ69_2007 [Thermomonospora umbrina]